MRMADADIMIDVLRGFPPALAWISSLTDQLVVPGYVVMELYAGCANKTQVEDVKRMVGAYQTLWASETACEQALNDFPIRHLSCNLGIQDAFIAACALEQRATLCTFNVKHFRNIPGLVLEQPYRR